MTLVAGYPDVLDAGLPTVDYEHSASLQKAHEIISAVRRQSPIAIGDHGPELLTYDLARAALRDPRLRTPQGTFLAAQGITSGPVWDRMCSLLISLDGPSHLRLRRLVAAAFTPRTLERLRARCAEVINELIDEYVDAGHCDVVSDIARRYPIAIICELLGTPAEDWKLFSHWTEDLFKVFGWSVAADESAILSAWAAIDDYVDDMIAARRHHLTDDLISDLIRAEEDGDRLSADELRMLVINVLTAGTDTTRYQLAASVGALLDHPGQWAMLATVPGLAPAAVEETMRHSPMLLGTLRTVRQDMEIGGLGFAAGTHLYVSTAAANRDPAVYADPDRLDITRQSPAPIQTFGGGAHHCLGAHLARLELAEALTALARRLPGAHRLGPSPWMTPLTALSGPTTMPIAWS